MTTATPELPAQLSSAGGVTQWHVVRLERTKFWSLRSTRWSLVVAVIVMAGLGLLVSALRMSRWSHMSPSDRASFNPVDVSLGGVNLVQLAVGVLGVLVISGEYSTGSIRSSFAAVPRRLPVLWAKACVFAAVVIGPMVPSALVAFLISQTILKSHHAQTSLGASNVLRAVIGAALFLAIVGLLGLAFGALLRNTAAGISALLGIMFVPPPLNALLPSAWSNAIDPYLPLIAGTAIMAIHSSLSPWAGFGVLCGYTAVVGGIAAYLLVRRDA